MTREAICNVLVWGKTELLLVLCAAARIHGQPRPHGETGAAAHGNAGTASTAGGGDRAAGNAGRVGDIDTAAVCPAAGGGKDAAADGDTALNAVAIFLVIAVDIAAIGVDHAAANGNTALNAVAICRAGGGGGAAAIGSDHTVLDGDIATNTAAIYIDVVLNRYGVAGGGNRAVNNGEHTIVFGNIDPVAVTGGTAGGGDRPALDGEVLIHIDTIAEAEAVFVCCSSAGCDSQAAGAGDGEATADECCRTYYSSWGNANSSDIRRSSTGQDMVIAFQYNLQVDTPGIDANGHLSIPYGCLRNIRVPQRQGSSVIAGGLVFDIPVVATVRVRLQPAVTCGPGTTIYHVRIAYVNLNLSLPCSTPRISWGRQGRGRQHTQAQGQGQTDTQNSFFHFVPPPAFKSIPKGIDTGPHNGPITEKVGPSPFRSLSTLSISKSLAKRY